MTLRKRVKCSLSYQISKMQEVGVTGRTAAGLMLGPLSPPPSKLLSICSLPPPPWPGHMGSKKIPELLTKILRVKTH